MADDYRRDDEPCFVISVAAKLVQLHPQTLRYYDRIGLISPSRTSGRIRLYSQHDIETLRKIARLTDDLGVNLAGVEVILNMSERIENCRPNWTPCNERPRPRWRPCSSVCARWKRIATIARAVTRSSTSRLPNWIDSKGRTP